MSIIDAFDNKSKSIIDLEQIFKEPKNIAEVCIVTFSIHVKNMVLEKYKCEPVAYSGTANGKIDVYLLEEGDKKILFYMSPIGSACAAAVMHEVHYATGANKFVVYGSCGILDEEKCKGNLIIPKCCDTTETADPGLLALIREEVG